MTEKNYAQSIAGDLFHMIHSAREQKVDVDRGFRNQAMSSPSMTLTYMFLTKDDLLSVPAGIKHWFDMGEQPDFKCIRLFTNTEGWVADYTGSPIADSFPRFEQFLASHA